MNRSLPVISWFTLAIAFIAATNAHAQSMREIETRHYLVRTDLDPALSNELAARLDVMYDEYARRLSDFAAPSDETKCEVDLFTRRLDFARLTGDRYPNVGGVFMPGKNLVAAFLESQGREALRRTIQHEAFHQFAYGVVSHKLPIWLNEGLAQVFEEGIWTGDRFLLGQVPPRRIRQLRADMASKRLIPFEQLLTCTDEAWAKNMADRSAATTQYNQAWAMAHFLIYAADDAGEPRYRARLLQMLRAIHAGASGDGAFRTAFSDNVKGFQDRFTEWAGQLMPTPEATYVENLSILGDMLISLDHEGVHLHAIDDFKQRLARGGYRLQYTRGQMVWSTSSDPSIYFSDLAGKAMTTRQLDLDFGIGREIPDVLCRVIDGMQFRARVYPLDSRLQTEVLIEPSR